MHPQKKFNLCECYFCSFYQLFIYPVTQQFQLMKAQLKYKPHQNFQFLDNQCKVCYLQLDNKQHYPTFICPAEHVICRQCFLLLSHQKNKIKCPFCLRKISVQSAKKSRYALMSYEIYKLLKIKYCEVMDDLNLILSQNPQISISQKLDRSIKQYKSLLLVKQQEINNLKRRNKQTEDANTLLRQQIQKEIERYKAFQTQIDQLKFNDLLRKNRLTMVYYQFDRLLKENQTLIKNNISLKQELFAEKRINEEYMNKEQGWIKEKLKLFCQLENFEQKIHSTVQQVESIITQEDCLEKNKPIIVCAEKQQKQIQRQEKTNKNSLKSFLRNLITAFTKASYKQQ